MFVAISILILVVCLLLAVVVLVQNSKGGGLAANFQAQSQIMGVRKTADFLEKASWGLAIALLVLCVAATAVVPNKNVSEKTKTELNPNAAKTNIPSAPTAPAATPIQQ
ncbi:MAG: preprotein translocase, SecG subunit [Bacteroidetes bacterium]|nr:preprotein translocase, SecG subunit [Bacteroidota bacterium]